MLIQVYFISKYINVCCTNCTPEWSLCNKVCYFATMLLECTLFVKFILVYFLQSTSGCKMPKDTLERTLVSLASLVS